MSNVQAICSARPAPADRYAVGVDAGGSGTRALLTRRGQCLAHGQAGGGNLRQVGVEQVMVNLIGAVRDAFSQAGLSVDLDCCAVHAGVAGLATEADRQALAGAPHPFGRLTLQGDALLTLDAYFAGGPGALLLIGTGCVALARAGDGTLQRRLGWGFPLEQGGGADLGLQAVRLGLGDWEDARHSLLRERLQLEFPSPRAVMEWSRGQRATGYARFAPLLFEAQQHDERAARAVSEWRTLCQTRLEEVARQSGVTWLGSWGGLAEHLSWPQQDMRWQAPRFAPLEWAARLAAGEGPA